MLPGFLDKRSEGSWFGVQVSENLQSQQSEPHLPASRDRQLGYSPHVSLTADISMGATRIVAQGARKKPDHGAPRWMPM